ncbi:MAG TPA: DUF4142 domain-containing protein [Mucilaginibacter sp.]|jgi:predicted outer membrane protein
MNTNQHASDTVEAIVTELEFRKGVIPRAQLSMLASQLAVAKATNKNTKEFAGFELMEAIAVIDVLKEVGTPVPAIDPNSQAFLSQLESLEGDIFDKAYMQAEQDNHEYLRDLAQNYLNGKAENLSAADPEVRRLAKVALYAFTEHVAMSKRINGELNA